MGLFAQLRHAHAEHVVDALAAQRHEQFAEHLHGAPAGADGAPRRVQCNHGFTERAQADRLCVEVQARAVAEAVGKPLALDQPRCHAGQRERMRVVGAAIAGDVDHAKQRTLVIEDRCGRAGQKLHRAQEVFLAMDKGGALGHQRRADRVGALAGFSPLRAWSERYALRAFKKTAVAHGMQDHAAGIAEHDHALRMRELLKHHFHDRLGLSHQARMACAQLLQLRRAEAVLIGL